jgi:hypothetical protein
MNVKTSACKVPLLLLDFNKAWTFSTDFRNKAQVSNFINICPVGVELFHAEGQTDGRTDGHDEANSRFFLNFAKRG